MLDVLLTCVPAKQRNGGGTRRDVTFSGRSTHPEYQNCNISWGRSFRTCRLQPWYLSQEIHLLVAPSFSFVDSGLAKVPSAQSVSRSESTSSATYPYPRTLEASRAIPSSLPCLKPEAKIEQACHMCHQRKRHVLAVIFVYHIRYCRFAVGPVCRD